MIDPVNFFYIFTNNMRVLASTLILSFVYGFGAIFIIVWNATVLAVALGNLIRTQFFSLYHILPLAIGKYFIHGTLEILGYLIAGIAGSLISVAIVRERFGSNNFWIVLKDAFFLCGIAVVILLFAALIESYLVVFF